MTENEKIKEETEGVSKLRLLKRNLKNVNNVTPWEDVKVNEVYHIAPIVTLDRRDVLILEKNDDELKYRKLGVNTNTESFMHRTSVFARFLVKRKSF